MSQGRPVYRQCLEDHASPSDQIPALQALFVCVHSGWRRGASRRKRMMTNRSSPPPGSLRGLGFSLGSLNTCVSLLQLPSQIPQAGWLQQHLFSYTSRGWKMQIKVSAGLVPSEVSVIGLQMVIFSLGPHMVVPRYQSLSQVPLLKRSPIELGPTLMTSF